MNIVKLIAIVALSAVVGCQYKDAPGMLGFKLGQVIDYEDKDELREHGIFKVEKDNDGPIFCKFKVAKPFMSFRTGNVTLDPSTKQIYVILAYSENPDGLARQCDDVKAIMTDKFSCEWSEKEMYNTKYYTADLGNGQDARIMYDPNGELCISVGDNNVAKAVKRRRQKKDYDNFD